MPCRVPVVPVWTSFVYIRAPSFNSFDTFNHKTHAACRTGDGPDGRVHVCSREIRLLGPGDLLELRTRHRTQLVGVGFAAALRNAGSPGLGEDTVAKRADGVQDSLSDSFATMVDQAVGNVASSTATSEMTAAQMLTGQADMVDIVTAASNAEMVVETVVTVRDKVISAYNDILKMPI